MNVIFPRGMIAEIGNRTENTVRIVSSRRCDLDIVRATNRDGGVGSPVVPQRVPPVELQQDVANWDNAMFRGQSGVLVEGDGVNF